MVIPLEMTGRVSGGTCRRDARSTSRKIGRIGTTGTILRADVTGRERSRALDYCFRISGKRSEKLPPPRDCKGDERREMPLAQECNTGREGRQVERPQARISGPETPIPRSIFPEGGKGAFDE